MNDLDIIMQIEKELSVKLERLKHRYVGTKGYMLNPKGKVSILTLYDCKIKDIQMLSNLKELKSLTLSKNEITQIESLGNLEKLQELFLRENQIRDISTLSKLSNLTQLDLRENRIADISPLKGLKKLVALELSINQIADISALKELKKLNDLNIAYNLLTTLPEWITDFEMEFESNAWDSHEGYINLYDNPLTNPPLTIITQGKKELVKYFKRNQPLRTFISYSKFDGEVKEDGRDYLNDFKKTLYPLIHQKHVLDTWDDTSIRAGEDWDVSIKTGLNTADVVFVLVSKNLISTNYIQETELRIAIERERNGECLVIPIIIKSCSWADINLFSEKQCIPRKGYTIASFAKNDQWETIDDAWQHVYDEIKLSIENFRAKKNNT